LPRIWPQARLHFGNEERFLPTIGRASGRAPSDLGNPFMQQGKIGLWLVGALGGVAATVSLGLAALRRGLMDETSLTTALPLFDGVSLPAFADMIVGGHDIRQGSLRAAAMDLHRRSNVFDRELLEACGPDLDEWSANICTGTTQNAGAAINKIADLPEAAKVQTAREAIDKIKGDVVAFRSRHGLNHVIVIHIASTEPPFTSGPEHDAPEKLLAALKQRHTAILPASSLYALAAIELGLPYVNFTPSLGASCPALVRLAEDKGTVVAGQDGKTGETLLKTVLAPMFAARNWQVLSWVGHNIFGNRDGLILDDPANKASKIKTKDKVTSQILGYKPQSHVSIEYIPSLDDWKTAWDHIHFRGFLGVKMMMQFTWQGCDSILAAPLVLDLARLTLLAHGRGETGILRHLACYFKNPMGVDDHDFFRQLRLLEDYVRFVQTPTPG
jgi:myo-inositol-1-phosphate synthase